MSPHPHTNIAWKNLFQVISQPNGEGICSNLDYLKANTRLVKLVDRLAEYLPPN